MNLVQQEINKALTSVLRAEIDDFRKSDKAQLLNEETFNPLHAQACFLGQTKQQRTPAFRLEDTYRNQIGKVPQEYALGSSGDMTPLEIWSAANWENNKETVLQVVRYIKGTVDMLPEVVWARPSAN